MAKREALTNKGIGGSLYVADRVLFLTHRGKSVLLVDLSYCSAVELERAIRGLPNLVCTHPRNSLLVLTDYTGVSFDDEAIRAIKETVVFNKPYVKKSAITGTENIPKELYGTVKSYSRREFFVFKTRDEALTWLVKE